MLTLFSIGCYSPFVLLFFAAGVVFAVRAGKEIRLMSDLDKHGRLTIGHIVRHRVYTLGRGALCYVSYYYKSQEQDYNHEQEIDNDHFNTLKDGERVCVRYLPQNPHTSMLALEHRDDAKARRYRRTALVQFVIATFFLMLPLCVWVVQR
jgi:hypothetical protein